MLFEKVKTVVEEDAPHDVSSGQDPETYIETAISSTSLRKDSLLVMNYVKRLLEFDGEGRVQSVIGDNSSRVNSKVHLL